MSRAKTTFEQSIPDYRKRILTALFKALVLPPLSVVSASYTLPLNINALALATGMLASIPLTIIIRTRYSVWKQDRAAIRLNVKPIPRVRGKWPGNLDIVLRMVKVFEHGYVFQGFSELFEEYQCTTLNTRIFWTDQVRLFTFSYDYKLIITQIITMDERVLEFVSLTGFQHFEKGIGWHERM